MLNLLRQVLDFFIVPVINLMQFLKNKYEGKSKNLVECKDIEL